MKLCNHLVGIVLVLNWCMCQIMFDERFVNENVFAIQWEHACYLHRPSLK